MRYFVPGEDACHQLEKTSQHLAVCYLTDWRVG
jgi:hypothetical protein